MAFIEQERHTAQQNPACERLRSPLATSKQSLALLPQEGNVVVHARTCGLWEGASRSS